MIYTKYECWSYVLVLINLMISAFVGIMTEVYVGGFIFCLIGEVLNKYRYTIKEGALSIVFVLGLLLALMDMVNSFV